MLWQKIRSGAMFVAALVSCPCHLPATLPLVLALLAGTSAAAWIAQNAGWIYSVMAGVFILSLALGLVWSGSPKESTGKVCEPRPGRAKTGSQNGYLH